VPDHRGLFDDGLAPNCAQELIFLDNLTLMGKHQQQNVEGARGQCDEASVAPEQSAHRIYQKRTE